MLQTFGHYIEVDGQHECVSLNFSPSIVPLKKRWHHNSLTANYLADSAFILLPPEDEPCPVQQAKIKDAISYIANELLENALEYGSGQHPIKISLFFNPVEVRFYVTNWLDPNTQHQFQQFIGRLLEEDLNTLYVSQIEDDVDGGDRAHLGLLTLVLDYEAQLGWKFESSESEPEAMSVTTMVQMPILSPENLGS